MRKNATVDIPIQCDMTGAGKSSLHPLYQVNYADDLKQRLIDVWHGFEQCHQLRR